MKMHEMVATSASPTHTRTHVTDIKLDSFEPVELAGWDPEDLESGKHR